MSARRTCSSSPAIAPSSSCEFSVGATGLRISGGDLGQPVREMTIASTIPEMLQSVAALGSELRWFSAVGVPSILLGEMTLAGV